MKVAVTDNRKTTRPLYVQGLKYILSPGKRHLFDVDEETFERLSKSGFLTVECLGENILHKEAENESIHNIEKIDPHKSDDINVVEEKVSEIVDMDSNSIIEMCDPDTGIETKEKVDYSFMTVQQLKDLLTENNVDISNAKKRKELISLAEERLG